MWQHNEIEALVVGAGPSGLALALALAVQGVAVRVIDKALEPSRHSKALAIQAKTLELFQKLGVVDEFLAQGYVSNGMRIFVEGKERLHVEFSDIGFRTTPYPYVFFLSQVETERILTEQLAKRGITIERGTTLVDFRDEGSSVRARIQAQDGSEAELACLHLFGCDGAHSITRKVLGLEFHGAAYEQSFILGDVHADASVPSDTLSVFLGKEGVMAVFPMGDGIVRLIAARPDMAPAAARDDELPLAELTETARYYTEKPTVLKDPVWLAPFHLHHRAVDRYARGRAFLVGDAAHIHSPAGGQGMNTGIQDAYNLAWKVGLLHRKLASEALLATYDEERRPVGHFLLKRTDRFFEIASSGNRLLTTVRNVLVPLAVRTLFESERGRRFVFGFVSQLGIKYRESRIVSESVTEPAGAFAHGPKPGYQAPDAPFVTPSGERSTLFAQMLGPKFHLLVFRKTWSDGSWKKTEAKLLARLGAFAEAVTMHAVAGGKVCRERYGVDGDALYLIRPDGYVAFRANHLDANGLAKHVELYR